MSYLSAAAVERALIGKIQRVVFASKPLGDKVVTMVAIVSPYIGLIDIQIEIDGKIENIFEVNRDAKLASVCFPYDVVRLAINAAAVYWNGLTTDE